MQVFGVTHHIHDKNYTLRLRKVYSNGVDQPRRLLRIYILPLGNNVVRFCSHPQRQSHYNMSVTEVAETKTTMTTYSEDNLPEYTPMPWYALYTLWRSFSHRVLSIGRSVRFEMQFPTTTSSGTLPVACYISPETFFSLLSLGSWEHLSIPPSEAP